MSFTPKERQQGRDDKRKREAASAPKVASDRPTFTCLHCNNEFTASDGVASEDVFICHTCID